MTVETLDFRPIRPNATEIEVRFDLSFSNLNSDTYKLSAEFAQATGLENTGPEKTLFSAWAPGR